MQPNTSQSSFIPKQSSKRPKRRRPSTKRIFVFAIVAYSLVFAALIASGGSFLYKNYSTGLLEDEVAALDVEIETFQVGQLAMVSETDRTLKRATKRFNHNASIATVLDVIDSATAQPIQFISLDIERVGDEHLTLVANVTAASFDAALFQRQLLNDEPRLFSQVVVEDVTVAVVTEESAQGTISSLNDKSVTFTVTMQVPIDAIAATSVGAAANTVGAVPVIDNQISS